MKVICPHCNLLDLKSTVQQELSMTLAVHRPSYYDEEGNLVSLDTSDLTTIQYKCSNGHNFTNKDL